MGSKGEAKFNHIAKDVDDIDSATNLNRSVTVGCCLNSFRFYSLSPLQNRMKFKYLNESVHIGFCRQGKIEPFDLARQRGKPNRK